jgi:hypothetical protein
MSSTGNRSHPNRTRTNGQPETPDAAGTPGGAGTAGGSHQESRDHHKHNNPGQSGHKPQRHGPAEEKH